MHRDAPKIPRVLGVVQIIQNGYIQLLVLIDHNQRPSELAIDQNHVAKFTIWRGPAVRDGEVVRLQRVTAVDPRKCDKDKKHGHVLNLMLNTVVPRKIKRLTLLG